MPLLGQGICQGNCSQLGSLSMISLRSSETLSGEDRSDVFAVGPADVVLPQLRMPPWRCPLEVFFLKWKKTLVVVVFSLTVLWDFCHQGWTCLNVLNDYDLTSEQWKKVIVCYRKPCSGFYCWHFPHLQLLNLSAVQLVFSDGLCATLIML